MANNEKQKVKKKRGGFVAGVLVTLLAMAGLGHFGFGVGGGPGFFLNKDSQSGQGEAKETTEATKPQETVEQTTEKKEETTATVADTLVVEVKEDVILVEGKEVKAEDLASVLSTADTGKKWVLRDNHAQKTAYDAAKEALTKAGISFTEEDV